MSPEKQRNEGTVKDAAGMKIGPSSVWPWLSVEITICVPN